MKKKAVLIILIFVLVTIILLNQSNIIDEITSSIPHPTTTEILPLDIILDDISVTTNSNTDSIIKIKFKINNPNSRSVILQMLKYELYENNNLVKIGQIGELANGMVDSSNYFTILHNNGIVLTDRIIVKDSPDSEKFLDSIVSNNIKWEIKGKIFFNLSSMISGGENEIDFELTF